MGKGKSFAGLDDSLNVSLGNHQFGFTAGPTANSAGIYIGNTSYSLGGTGADGYMPVASVETVHGNNWAQDTVGISWKAAGAAAAAGVTWAANALGNVLTKVGQDLGPVLEGGL